MSSIGFVSSSLQGSGGLERFELEIARGLAELGWQISILYNDDGDLSAEWARFARMARRADISGPGAASPERNPLVDSDLLYCHAPSLFAETLEFGDVLGIPVVGHLHLPPEHLRKGIKGMVFGRTRGTVDPDVFSRRTRVRRFIAVSNAMRQQWCATGLPADRVDVVHNGIDLGTYQPADTATRSKVRREIGLDDDALLLAYIGRIDPMKGIGELIEAFGLLPASERSVHLAIIGSPSRYLAEEGERFVSHLSSTAPPSVHWLGQRSDVARLYAAIDVLVVPSQWDEPFGLVAAEAMASGVCVVAADRGGLPEILRDDLRVNVVEPTPAALGARLHQLIAQPARIAEFGRRGREVVAEHFDLRDTIERIDKSLRSAM
ncbi:MAG TPA: glycosyltransferase family 4 protein [Acidimicrobiales bacterium]|jgi:glycosyltransferase involved in cell wall biosynthesis|nr:glycosyltransferase family 4 protein [Acidimicrobiales bacterium]